MSQDCQSRDCLPTRNDNKHMNVKQLSEEEKTYFAAKTAIFLYCREMMSTTQTRERERGGKKTGCRKKSVKES